MIKVLSQTQEWALEFEDFLNRKLRLMNLPSIKGLSSATVNPIIILDGRPWTNFANPEDRPTEWPPLSTSSPTRPHYPSGTYPLSAVERSSYGVIMYVPHPGLLTETAPWTVRLVTQARILPTAIINMDTYVSFLIKAHAGDLLQVSAAEAP